MDDKPFHTISLAEEKATLLITLYAKAFDNRSKHPILHDTKADEIAAQIEYDFAKVEGFALGRNLIVLRAKQLDEWLRAFLKANPQGVILNLGCGLDTRITRINPSPGVSWFDVDYPEVIAFRQQFYANHDGYTMIGSSVTDAQWLAIIPKTRPVMIIAEGLLEYLTEDEVQTLLTRLTDAFPHGQIVFDVTNSFAQRVGNAKRRKTTGAEHCSFSGPIELEAVRWIESKVQEVQCPACGSVSKAKLKKSSVVIIPHPPRKSRAVRNVTRWMGQGTDWELVQKKTSPSS